jgi:hypothetical protein
LPFDDGNAHVRFIHPRENPFMKMPYCRLTCVVVSALWFGGCAAVDPGQDEQASFDELAMDEGAPPLALATLKVSDTRTITFYKTGPHDGMVEERFELERDREPLIDRDDQIQVGHFAQLYRKVAGDAPNVAVPRLIELFDEEQAEYAAAKVPEIELDEPGLAESTGLVIPATTNKNLWSDLKWFSENYCNGCMGHDGQTAGYAPFPYPACTGTPNFCQAGGGRASYQMRSYAAHIYAYNLSNSLGDAHFNVTFPNDCENSGPIFRNCGFLSDFNAAVPVGHVVSRHYDATKRWTRRATITGPGNVMLMFD